MKKLLFIVGSQRRNSFNLRVAREVAQMLEGRADVAFLDYADVPLMNQDVEFPAPDAVARVRKAVEQADGLWFFTPEYNFSYPGALKNLLDWLSRPLDASDPSRRTSVTDKKATLSAAAGRSAGAGTRAKLSELLTVMKLDLMKEPQTGIALPGSAFGTDEFELDAAQRAELAAQADAFLAYLG